MQKEKPLSVYDRNHLFELLAETPRRIKRLEDEIRALRDREQSLVERLKADLPQAFTPIMDMGLSARTLKLCVNKGYTHAYHLAQITSFYAPEGFGRKTLDEISAALRKIEMVWLRR